MPLKISSVFVAARGLCPSFIVPGIIQSVIMRVGRQHVYKSHSLRLVCGTRRYEYLQEGRFLGPGDTAPN